MEQQPSMALPEALSSADPSASSSRLPRRRFRWKSVALLLCAFIVLDKAWHLLPSGGAAAGAREDLPAERGAPRRYLSSASSASSSASGSATGEEHHAHPHEAMFFLCIALVVGTFLLHLTSFKAFQGLQSTVTLFVLGAILSILMEATGLKDELGVVGRSYQMWVQIDPHLLLFTLLPPLLAGDAMSINTQVAGKVAKQCLFLAGPGVIINASLAAVFMYGYLPYDWSFMFCLTLGAVLCATDPVAVVALLKELGASPTLTVQIQGESLLNDGTAIVLYVVAYKITSGEEWNLDDIISFLIKSALYAWMLGLIIGGVFYMWIKAVKNRVDHTSPLLQVALTIGCAYASFVIAEGQFHVSGVLATVAASLMLAHNMWLEVVSHESMHTIWHMFEYLGNTIIFFLAGALTGNAMVRIKPVDYLHLVVIYVALIIIRGALILVSKPLLRCLHADFVPVSFEECIVMTWGGLRGAVGLALAIQVNMDKAGGELSQEDADRALFFVGGVALLTLIVNATSSPALVKRLGITRVKEAKRTLMLLFVQQLEVQAQVSTGRLDCCEDCRDNVGEMLTHLAHHLHREVSTRGSIKPGATCEDHFSEEHATARREWESVDKPMRDRIASLVHHAETEDSAHLLKAAQGADSEAPVTRAANEAFIALVRHQYTEFIEHGEAPSSLGEVLLASITHALSTNRSHLNDWEYLQASLGLTHDESLDVTSGTLDGDLASLQGAHVDHTTRLKTFLESAGFTIFISVAILINATLTIVEDEVHDDSNQAQNWAFACIELTFVIIFGAECVLRLMDERLNYFFNSWNVFDFVLVVTGVIGSVTGLMIIFDSGGESASNSQGARAMKVLKTLRAVRLLRLIRMFRDMLNHHNNKDEDPKIRKRMKRVNLLMWFIEAQHAAQEHMSSFFGKDAQAEVARCILESQTHVYQALKACAEDKKYLSPWILEEQFLCHESVLAMYRMEKTIEQANKKGLLSSREAHEILHTIHDHQHKMENRIENIRLGAATRPMMKTMTAIPTKKVTESKLAEEMKLEDFGAMKPHVETKAKNIDTE